MEEVYGTRQEELLAWIDRDNKRISTINERLSHTNLGAEVRSALEQELDTVGKNLEKHKEAYEQVDRNLTSDRWYGTGVATTVFERSRPASWHGDS